MSAVSITSQRKKGYNKFEWVFLLAFLFTSFSGAVRKWGINAEGVNNIILLGQLTLPWIIFFVFSTSARLKAIPFLVVFFVYLIIAAVNPLNATINHGILGIILHGGLVFALFAYIENREKFSFQKLIFWFLVVTAIQLALGVVQYFLPDTHILNKYLKIGENEGIAKVGAAVRVTGTFSYLGGYSAYVLFMVFLAWYTAAMKNIDKRLQFILIVGALIGASMNGSRSALAICILFSILIFISTKQSARLFYGFVFSVILIMATYSYVSSVQRFVDQTYENMMGRIAMGQNTGEQNSRVWGPIEEIIHFRGRYPMFGIGLGATYQGANSLWGESWYAKEYGSYEEEAERVILEGGWVLFFLRLIMFGLLAYYFKIPLYAFMAIVFICTFYLQIIFNTYNAFYTLMGLAMIDQAYWQQWVQSKRK